MATILIVDDAAFMRITLKNILTEKGHTVHEAVNGVDAVSKFQEVTPDLVTMDITMPEKNGIDAVADIKGLNPKARIVMCSALGQEAMVRKAISLGARDFIVKPFDAERVLAAVNNALAS